MMRVVALTQNTLVSLDIKCNTKKLFQLPPPYSLIHQRLVIE